MAWEVPAAGSVRFIFCSSARWYFCWYRQQLAMKIVLNSYSYDTMRLPARGTISLR
jgi:hypothetical protein